MERCPCSTPAEMELLDRIETRLENTSPSYRQCRFLAASKRGVRHTEVRHDAHRRGLRLLLPQD
jgi:hypothetical protein